MAASSPTRQDPTPSSTEATFVGRARTMALCAAATVCAHEGRCSAAASTPELALLVVLLLLPIFASIYQPSLARLQHGRLEPETVGCGACIPPRMCARSGLLAVVVLLVLGFVPTFFLLLTSPDPCDTALGACGSISCACGNFLQQGYVWMFVTLFVASMLLTKEFARMPGRVNGRARALKSGLAAASLLPCLTAIFPEHFSLDASDPELMLFATGYALHGLGLAIASLTLVFLPFVCTALALRAAPRPAHATHALLVRAAHLSLALAYAGAFAALRGHADVSDFCAPIASEAECAAWPPAAACARLGRLRGAAGHRLPTSYTCAWDNASLTPVEALLYPREYVASHSGVCRKARCALYANARSIALEFGVLLLVATYAIGYALGDMRWVIGNIVATDPRERAAEAEAEAEAAVLVVHDAALQRQPSLGAAPVNA